MHSIYSYTLQHDAQGRIAEKIETVQGRSNRWTYAYDKKGRLFEARLDNRLICQCYYDKQGRRIQDSFPATHGVTMRTFRYTMDSRLQAAGNNGYTHDRQGMRILWNSGGNYTRYEYAPDHRLLRATREWDGTVFEFAHDEQGRRAAKFMNGTLVEAYHWLDFIRLAAFHDGAHEFVFTYRSDERTPHTMRRDDGAVFTLHYDQIGSLRAVADQGGNMIQEILYDPFGGIIEDTNPGLRIPIGFAGGLHDRDLGFVRFGWRDYDTYTGRWTAPDPLGDEGGDPDWYGYCLDDPVNGVDPLGLEGGFWGGMRKIGVGLGALWDKAPAGIGEAVTKGTRGAGEALSKTAEAFATNENLQKYTVISLGAGALPIAAAVGTATGPVIAGAAMQHPEKLAAGSKAVGDFVSGALDQGPPPASPAGYSGVATSKVYDWLKARR